MKHDALVGPSADQFGKIGEDETGVSICNRNRIMTELQFLFRVTIWRLDLAAEILHLVILLSRVAGIAIPAPES